MRLTRNTLAPVCLLFATLLAGCHGGSSSNASKGFLASQDRMAGAQRTAARTAAGDVPVPGQCTPAVNAHLEDLIASRPVKAIDNVMVCGITASSSRRQKAGKHGSHQMLVLRVNFPTQGTRLVEVVSNDTLNGVVTAPAGAQVIAYGQAFFQKTRPYAAGIHDVHCSTHRGADNGWVVVNGEKTPSSCPAAY